MDIVNIAHNPWVCSCDPTSKRLMQFLSQRNIFPCCPSSCRCSANDGHSLEINCTAQNKTILPSCLPFDYVKLYYGNNRLKSVNFTKYQANVTFLYLHNNHISNVEGHTLGILKNLTHFDLRFNNLTNLPKEMRKLKTAKIFLRGKIAVIVN